MRDTSLDDFIGGGDGKEHEDENDDEGGDSGDEDDDSDDADAVQPAVSTYEWTPDGASCAECDVVAERRWRDDGALVCADCKDW